VIESQRLESSRVAAGFAIENASLVVKRVGCVDAPHALSPSPQLFPNLDECLYFSRAGQSTVNQPAIFERAFIELANTIGTQVCEGGHPSDSSALPGRYLPNPGIGFGILEAMKKPMLRVAKWMGDIPISLLGNDARFQYLRIIPSRMEPARRANSFQVMFLSWLTKFTLFLAEIHPSSAR
jgi:hypothetical protein